MIPGHSGKTYLKSEKEVLLEPGFLGEKGTDISITIVPHIIWDNMFSTINLLLEEQPQLKHLIDSIINENPKNGIYSVKTIKLILYPNPFTDIIYIKNAKIGAKYFIKNLYSIC